MSICSFTGRAGPAPDAHALRAVPLLASIDPDAFEALRLRMWVRIVQAGREIIGAQEVGPAPVFFLMSGRAKVLLRSEDGRVVRLCEVHAGDIVGELAAIDGEGRSAAVEALETCRLAAIGHAAFLELVTSNSAACLALLKVLAARLRLQSARALERVALDARGRIARELVRLSTLREGRRVVSPVPLRVDLAATLGLRRETVTRELSQLTRDGMITHGPGHVMINEKLLHEWPAPHGETLAIA